MKALFYNFKNKKFSFRAAPIPKLKKGEALIRVYFSALCGTDLHVMRGAMKNKAYNKKEIILGHAWVGKIVKQNSGSPKFSPNDFVYGTDYFPCGRCSACFGGRENNCDSRSILGVERRGSHAEFVSAPLKNLRKLPRSINPLLGSYVADCVAVADRAIRRADFKKENEVAIYGAGPIGLCLGLLLREVYKVKNISVAEPSAYRRNLAKKLFAPNFFKAKKEKKFKNAFDIAYEASGQERALQSAFYSVRRGGEIVVLGVHDKTFKLDAFKLVSRDLRISGTFTYPLSELNRAVSLAKKINAENLLTDIFPLRAGGLAYKKFAAKKTGIVILNCGQSNSI